jgi:methylthioribose-1-phosphate isomerase
VGDDVFAPLVWKRGTLYVLDQLELPAAVTWRPCHSADDVVRVIAERRVRGASATACATAYAIALAARARIAAGAGQRGPGGASYGAGGPVDAPVLRRTVEDAVEGVRRAVPSSVHVFYALAQVRDAGRVSTDTADAFMVADAIEARACAIHAEDIARCQRIGDAGATLVKDGTSVLTLGNHGALATGGWGTALGILRSAWRQSRRLRVLVCESRPLLDGARLSAWELAREGLDVTVVPDGAAPGLLSRRELGLVVLGAERISSSGDVVSDLGSYGIALAAAAAVPVVVAAPHATIDPATSLAIDDHPAETMRRDTTPIPERVAHRSPTADIVPSNLISAIVTEHGIHRAPWTTSLR